MKDKSKLYTYLIYLLNGLIIAPIYYFLFKNIPIGIAVGISLFIGIIIPTFSWTLFYLNTFYAINHHKRKPFLIMVIMMSAIYLIPAAIICYLYVIKQYSQTIANFNIKKQYYRNQRYITEVRCPNCNTLIIHGNNFCTQCGSTYLMKRNNQTTTNLQQKNSQFNNHGAVNRIKCPKCDDFIIAGGNFCDKCGYKLK